MAIFHAVVHAAANEIDAGRLDPAKASSTITRTMLATLGASPSLRREATPA